MSKTGTSSLSRARGSGGCTRTQEPHWCRSSSSLSTHGRSLTGGQQTSSSSRRHSRAPHVSTYHFRGHQTQDASRQMPIILMIILALIILALGFYLYSQATECRMRHALTRTTAMLRGGKGSCGGGGGGELVKSLNRRLVQSRFTHDARTMDPQSSASTPPPPPPLHRGIVRWRRGDPALAWSDYHAMADDGWWTWCGGGGGSVEAAAAAAAGQSSSQCRRRRDTQSYRRTVPFPPTLAPGGIDRTRVVPIEPIGQAFPPVTILAHDVILPDEPWSAWTPWILALNVTPPAAEHVIVVDVGTEVLRDAYWPHVGKRMTDGGGVGVGAGGGGVHVDRCSADSYPRNVVLVHRADDGQALLVQRHFVLSWSTYVRVHVIHYELVFQTHGLDAHALAVCVASVYNDVRRLMSSSLPTVPVVLGDPDRVQSWILALTWGRALQTHDSIDLSVSTSLAYYRHPDAEGPDFLNHSYGRRHLALAVESALTVMGPCPTCSQQQQIQAPPRMVTTTTDTMTQLPPQPPPSHVRRRPSIQVASLTDSLRRSDPFVMVDGAAAFRRSSS